MSKFRIATDFGGTEVKMGIFEDDRLINFSTYKSSIKKSGEELLVQMKEHLDEINEELKLDYSDYTGIGIAMPGIVNFKKKTLISINDKYDDFVNFDFQSWCMKNLNLKCVLDNDANAALLGERAVGTTENAKNAVIFILGTGVGTAAILDGKLIRGAHFQAGCIGGHSIINIEGRKCNCGTLGCVEAQASTWALGEIVKEDKKYLDGPLHKLEKVGMKDLWDNYLEGDEFSVLLHERFVTMWSAGIVNLIHAYDPEIVVLSGGPFLAGEVFINQLKDKVNELAWTPYGEVKFAVSKNPKHSVIHGMKELVKEYLEI